MNLTLLKSKLHRATVTGTDLQYEGSISIDAKLLDLARILPFQQVDVYNINNGNRFTTYAIVGQAGSGEICINGAAARLAMPGDKIIVVAYGTMSAEEAAKHRPTVVSLGDHNRPLA